MGLLYYDEVGTFKHRVALVYVNSFHHTALTCVDVVLHLHGFEDNHHVVALERVAHLHLDIDNHAGQRRLNGRCRCRYHRFADDF